MQAPASYADVQEYLFSLKAGGNRFGIDRMRLLVGALGHPERAVPVVHVTGTNGKGSTAAMIEAVLRASGRRVGLYTSPHLVRLGERVQVDRALLTEAEIVAYVAELGPVAGRVSQGNPDDHASFFEFMTAMAFLQFARKRCDAAVVEVGMGGRLDATNVVDPEVSVITSISLDHCEQLGDTPEKIAAEKGGIIKPGRPVVIGRLPPGPEAVLRDIAARLGSPVHSVREAFGEGPDGYPETRLEGEYQRWNAATATLVARVLGPAWGLSPGHVQTGLATVTWPGRWERIRVGGRLLVLDASHNPEGAEVLEENLRRLGTETGRRPVVVTGVLGAARARPLMETVARHASEIHLVVPSQPRACSHAELESLIPAGFAGPVVRRTVADLFPDPGSCAAGPAEVPVVVTGSIYLLGEIMARLAPGRGPGEGRLQDF